MVGRVIVAFIIGIFFLIICGCCLFYSAKKTLRLKEKGLFEEVNRRVSKLFKYGCGSIIVGIGFFAFWSFLYYGFPFARVPFVLNHLLSSAILLVSVGILQLIMYYRLMKFCKKDMGVLKNYK